MKKLFFVASLFLSSIVFAQDKVILNVGLSPAGSFQATSEKVRGKLTKSGDSFTADKITVSVQSFKTGIDLRDDHFWKHMNSEKHSRATLSDLKAQGGKATANLEVNGVTKPVSISYKVVGNEVVANFTVKNSEFSLPKANYAGVGVVDEVKVEVTLGYK